MGLKNRYGVYHFSEMALVESESTTIVPVMSIPRGTVIEQVLVKVHTLCVRAAGAVNLIVGDDDDDNGFILAADAKAAVDTVYGETPSERGAYLFSTVGGFIKHYETDKTLRLVLSAAILTTDTEGEYEITVIGHRIGEP